MGEFFHGWKRKIALLTLLMALVAMAGWVRSGIEADTVIVNRRYIQFIVASFDGRLTFARAATHEPDEIMPPILWGSEGLEAFLLNEVDQYGMFKFRDEPNCKKWRWKWAGYHLATLNLPQDFNILSCCLPYWSITVPLTLLSVYLLLTKPRQSSQKKTDEPVAVDGV